MSGRREPEEPGPNQAPTELSQQVPEADRRRQRRYRRTRRALLVTGLVLALIVVGGTLTTGLYYRSVESGIDRIDAFDDVPEQARPQRVAQKASNLLILGSDSRDPDTSGSRTDTIIVAHLPADRASAQLISIPRDTWVRVPTSKDGSQGGREAKINAAFAWGGVPLVVQTVESFTAVRIDHVVLIDFAGFKEIIDALGGVEIMVDQTFTSIHGDHRRFVEGKQHMDGEAALDYARDRKQFADGDFTRIRHQQQLIKAVLDKSASSGLLANPAKLDAFVRASADAVTVDRTMSILNMSMELRHLRGGSLTFLTSPSRGTGRVGTESVVFADAEKAEALYDAVRRDAVAEIAKLTR